MSGDFAQGLADATTERPITHVITIPLGLVSEAPSQSDLLLLVNRAVRGLLMSACTTNLVPAYIGMPSIDPVQPGGTP